VCHAQLQGQLQESPDAQGVDVDLGTYPSFAVPRKERVSPEASENVPPTCA